MRIDTNTGHELTGGSIPFACRNVQSSRLACRPLKRMRFRGQSF